MDKSTNLQNIADEIVAQDVCPELRARATQLVFGEGDVDTNIVFVGEAPGKKEDEQGRPFVGAAGKFLNEMLGNIGIKRDDVYITNIVKYRPPDNRDPRPEEKQAFWPFLVRHLNVIQPKLVVTLGRHSMGYFLPNIKISEVHGELAQIKIGDRIQAVLPLFHPAAAMYNGGLRQTLLNDFAKIPEIIKRIK